MLGDVKCQTGKRETFAMQYSRCSCCLPARISGIFRLPSARQRK